MRTGIWFLGCALAAGCGGHFAPDLSHRKAAAPGEHYVLIDAGSHLGETVDAFKHSHLYTEYPWEIYAIEADPELAARIPRAPDVTVMNDAVWTDDNGIQLRLGNHSTGNSVLDTSVIDESATPVQVPSIGFSKWLSDRFTTNDTVLVWMDIEGAEYDVLDQMIADHSVDLVDVLNVEFHGKITDVAPGRKENIVAMFEQGGAHTYVHEAMVDDLESNGHSFAVVDDARLLH